MILSGYCVSNTTLTIIAEQDNTDIHNHNHNVFTMHRAFWAEVWFLFTLLTGYSVSTQAKPINCAYLQTKVPKPQLKYMLTGQMHVIWRQEKTATFNYTAHACSTSLMTFPILSYANSCPRFQTINGCIQSSTPDSNIRQCSIQVFQYLEYSVYLNASYHGCQLNGRILKIKPRLSIAHPAPVPKLNVYSDQSNALFIEWTKAMPQEVNFMYSLRCQQVVNAIRKHFCCIRVRLPYGISPYYSEVCKASENIQVLASKFRCGNTHECKIAKVKNLRDFVGQLTTDTTTWPYSPPGVVLQVEREQ